MNLFTLARALTDPKIENARDVEITLVTSDSRQVVPGALFVAYPGLYVDGSRFIPQALERGAAAIVSETRPPTVPDCPLILVADARAALAQLAAAWYDYPSRKMRIIGITGTDGKTTTAMLASSILSAAGHKVGTITTVAATLAGQEIDTGLHTTTPDAPDVQRYLAMMATAGMQYAVIEATSEGLAQRRLDAVDFDVAAVTNITHEHLYFHQTWENYRDAKARLIRSLTTSHRKPRTSKVSVLNADDNVRGAFELLQAIPVEKQIIYTRNGAIASLGRNNQTWIYSEDVSHSPSGLAFTLVTPYGEMPLHSALLGEYNVSNILAAVGIGLARRIPFEAIREGVAQVYGVPGRMQVLQAEPFTAIVDFAHTPNALERALETARGLARNRVIVVFGCAGLRDVEKRGWMGEIAGRLADQIVVTAEDPRTESLASINAQIVQGLARAGRRENEDYTLVDDRAEAIAFAVRIAQPGDVVISCGKGHERSMCFGTTEYPWSDQEAMEQALQARGK